VLEPVLVVAAESDDLFFNDAACSEMLSCRLLIVLVHDHID